MDEIEIIKNINNDLRIYEQEKYADIMGDRGTYVVSVRTKDSSTAIIQIFVSNNMIFPGRITGDIKKAAVNCNSR